MKFGMNKILSVPAFILNKLHGHWRKWWHLENGKTHLLEKYYFHLTSENLDTWLIINNLQRATVHGSPSSIHPTTCVVMKSDYVRSFSRRDHWKDVFWTMWNTRTSVNYMYHSLSSKWRNEHNKQELYTRCI